MAYATQQDLIDRFGSGELAQLTDRTAGVTIDAAVVARALTDAQAMVDSYLATRYALPLASTPVILTRIASDIARYMLHEEGAPEIVRQRYEDAVRDLKGIAAGSVQIDAAAALTPVGIVSPVKSRTSAKQFNADSLAGY